MLHSATLNGHSLSFFEERMGSASLNGKTLNQKFWESINAAAKTVFRDWTKPHTTQKKHMQKGHLHMFDNAPAHFVARLESLSKHLTCFPRTTLNNGNWSSNKPLSSGVLPEISEEARSAKLVTLMTERKESADKHESTDDAEQKKKCHEHADFMEQWNNMLKLTEKLLESKKKQKNDSNATGNSWSSQSKRQKNGENKQRRTKPKHCDKHHEASKADCWKKTANKKENGDKTGGDKNLDQKRCFEKFQKHVTSNVIKALEATPTKPNRDADEDVNNKEAAFASAFLSNFASSKIEKSENSKNNKDLELDNLDFEFFNSADLCNCPLSSSLFTFRNNASGEPKSKQQNRVSHCAVIIFANARQAREISASKRFTGHWHFRHHGAR